VISSLAFVVDGEKFYCGVEHGQIDNSWYEKNV
jgi:hypothetical protein